MKFSVWLVFLIANCLADNIKIWGPGLKPHLIVMPARYFFIQANSANISESDLDVQINGNDEKGEQCHIWTNKLNRKDGTFIIRYKVYRVCTYLKISVQYQNKHVGESPYVVNDVIYPEDCPCPKKNLEFLLKNWECGETPEQITKDLKMFNKIDWNLLRNKIIERYDNPGSISLCHYVIKNNEIYNKCYGKYVGFKMFIENMLLSLSRKVVLPDLEFFVNLGDWPLVKSDEDYPVFSWCGSTDSHDIIMPTYDISESTLENMGRVTLDMLSVQGNVNEVWEKRIPKVFWRGRDSNLVRLKLIDIARANADLFNVSLTNFFFFRDKEEIYGPKANHVSFFSFFDYKYQLSIDGTVAAYRLPYLLAGGSSLLKQDSKYYEHFYKELIPNQHYIPVAFDLSDLLEKIKWAIENDESARRIAKSGQDFAVNNLMPKNIFCYYTSLLNEFSKLIISDVQIVKDMTKIEQSDRTKTCQCLKDPKNEL